MYGYNGLLRAIRVYIYMNKTGIVMLLLASTGTMVNTDGEIKEIVLQILGISQEQLDAARKDLEKELGRLQTGLTTWRTVPTSVFNSIAINWNSCSETDVAIFPFAQGLADITIDDFWNTISIDRINSIWQDIHLSVKDVHEVRSQLHQRTCKNLEITNSTCGQQGYKQIEERIKQDKEYALRYKQAVADGLVISHLYESGVLR